VRFEVIPNPLTTYAVISLLHRPSKFVPSEGIRSLWKMKDHLIHFNSGPDDVQNRWVNWIDRELTARRNIVIEWNHARCLKSRHHVPRSGPFPESIQKAFNQNAPQPLSVISVSTGFSRKIRDIPIKVLLKRGFERGRNRNVKHLKKVASMCW
jgi:hypothetical protein